MLSLLNSSDGLQLLFLDVVGGFPDDVRFVIVEVLEVGQIVLF